jgi:hypothetical protein
MSDPDDSGIIDDVASPVEQPLQGRALPRPERRLARARVGRALSVSSSKSPLRVNARNTRP